MEIPILSNIDVLRDSTTGAVAVRQQFSWRIGPVTNEVLPGPVKEHFMTIQLLDNQKVSLTITGGLDAKGAPATISDVPTWVSNTPTVAAVVPAADGLSAEVSAGVPGTAQVVITDPAGGATSTVDFVVVAGTAVSFAITAGTPVTE